MLRPCLVKIFKDVEGVARVLATPEAIEYFLLLEI